LFTHLRLTIDIVYESEKPVKELKKKLTESAERVGADDPLIVDRYYSVEELVI
jgi:hypothetical protein